MRAGAVVYRVIEVDPPPDVPGPHTWRAAAGVVERASSRQIRLQRPFPGLARVVFEPRALGRLFFATPLGAIQHFLTERQLEVESLLRRKKEAERAIAWAASQEGMQEVPVPRRADNGDAAEELRAGIAKIVADYAACQDFTGMRGRMQRLLDRYELHGGLASPALSASEHEALARARDFLTLHAFSLGVDVLDRLLGSSPRTT